jgi:hypothetical protein
MGWAPKRTGVGNGPIARTPQCLFHPSVRIPMIRLFLALVLLVSISWEAQSLSHGEMEALKGILEAWPTLGTLDHPWNASNVAQACGAPTWHGLRCSRDADPHVLGLYAEFSKLPYLKGCLFANLALPSRANLPVESLTAVLAPVYPSTVHCRAR